MTFFFLFLIFRGEFSNFCAKTFFLENTYALWPVADLESFSGGDFRHETSKIRMSSPNDFSAEIGNSNVFFAQNQVVSKKKVFTEIKGNFSAEILRLRLVGGDASRNGAELFEIEADFSAKIVTFRLVGGMHPPHPPLNPPQAVALVFVLEHSCLRP